MDGQGQRGYGDPKTSSARWTAGGSGALWGTAAHCLEVEVAEIRLLSLSFSLLVFLLGGATRFKCQVMAEDTGNCLVILRTVLLLWVSLTLQLQQQL